MTDEVRTGLIALLNAFFPLLQILNIVHWDGTQVAAVTAFTTTAVAFAFLVFKKGQGIRPIIGGGVAAVILGLALAGGHAHVARAAVDCGVASPTGITVNVYDVDATTPGTRVSSLGAMVKFQPDPLDGIGSLTIADGGPYDDSPLTGRIQVEEACSGVYSLTLSFGPDFKCDVAKPTAETSNVEGDAVVSFDVNDCASTVTPTPTATATSTPTATATPAATSTPVPTSTAIPPTAVPQVIIIERVATPTAVPATSSIRPPNTGDAGLRASD